MHIYSIYLSVLEICVLMPISISMMTLANGPTSSMETMSMRKEKMILRITLFVVVEIPISNTMRPKNLNYSSPKKNTTTIDPSPTEKMENSSTRPRRNLNSQRANALVNINSGRTSLKYLKKKTKSAAKPPGSS